MLRFRNLPFILSALAGALASHGPLRALPEDPLAVLGRTVTGDLTVQAFKERSDLDWVIFSPAADLRGADFRGKTLAGANLGDADCSGACLDGVDLTRTGVSLAIFDRASLAGARIRLADAWLFESKQVRLDGVVWERTVADPEPDLGGDPALDLAARGLEGPLALPEPSGFEVPSSPAGPGLGDDPWPLAPQIPFPWPSAKPAGPGLALPSPMGGAGAAPGWGLGDPSAAQEGQPPMPEEPPVDFTSGHPAQDSGAAPAGPGQPRQAGAQHAAGPSRGRGSRRGGVARSASDGPAAPSPIPEPEAEAGEPLVGICQDGRPLHGRAALAGLTSLDGAVFLAGADLRNTSFQGKTLDRADLGGTDCTGVDFTRVDLTRTNLAGTRVDHAVFRGAKVTRSCARALQERGADLRLAQIVADPDGPAAVIAPGPGAAPSDPKTDWWRAFTTLKAFAEREGHLQVGGEVWAGHVHVSSWLRSQKTRLARLSREQVQALDSIPGMRAWLDEPGLAPPRRSAAPAGPVPGGDADTILGYYPGGRWLCVKDFGSTRQLDRLLFAPKAQLKGADFTGKTLSGADLGDADCTRARFRGVDLRSTGLARAILAGADFTDALLRPEDALALVSRGIDARGARFTEDKGSGSGSAAVPAPGTSAKRTPDRADPPSGSRPGPGRPADQDPGPKRKKARTDSAAVVIEVD